MAKWKPGNCGNPQGRPAGSPNKRTVIRDALMAAFPDGEAGFWSAVAVQAKAGDAHSQALIADRLFPKLRPVAEPIQFELQGETLTDAARSILLEVAGGNVDPLTGRSLIDAVASLVRVEEIDELKQRIEALEHGVVTK